MKNIVDLYDYTVEKGLKRHSDYLIRFINDEIFQKNQLDKDYFLEKERVELYAVCYMFKYDIIHWGGFIYEIMTDHYD